MVAVEASAVGRLAHHEGQQREDVGVLDLLHDGELSAAKVRLLCRQIESGVLDIEYLTVATSSQEVPLRGERVDLLLYKHFGERLRKQ